MKNINENTFYILFVSKTTNEYAIKEVPNNRLSDNHYEYAPKLGVWEIYREGLGKQGWDNIQSWLSKNMWIFI